MSFERMRQSFLIGWRTYLIAALLIISITFQLAIAWEHYISSWSPRIWSLRNSPAWVRAGLLSPWVGEEPTEFLAFVRETVPEDAKLITPPQSTRGVYRLVNLMQYFLFPRELTRCRDDQVEACLLANLAPDTYVLAVEGFPPQELISPKMHFLEYDGDLGIYEPLPGAIPQEIPALE